MIRKRLFCLQLTLILFTSACLFPLAANARDIYSDTWVAADGWTGSCRRPRKPER